MALKQNVNFENGISLNNAYIKILKLSGNKENIFLEVGVFKDFNYTDDKYVKKSYYNFKPNVADNSDNFIKQGYEFLKTLEEFKGAMDILEEGQ